jgi:hypothetical protein
MQRLLARRGFAFRRTGDLFNIEPICIQQSVLSSLNVIVLRLQMKMGILHFIHKSVQAVLQ